jgi:hypothetical protein
MAEFDEQLVRYFAARQEQRAERVESVVAALNPRERKLVREAAVMGYVRGAMAGAVAARAGERDATIPPDSFVLREVVDACLSMPDLYPTFERMERLANRRRPTGEVRSA